MYTKNKPTPPIQKLDELHEFASSISLIAEIHTNIKKELQICPFGEIPTQLNSVLTNIKTKNEHISKLLAFIEQMINSNLKSNDNDS